tara:strand:+ start:1501 stop:2058 length:558 start_codon:yes stop_codon:yes gene_type:complete
MKYYTGEIIFLGNRNTGKTTFINKFMRTDVKSYAVQQPTVGVDFIVYKKNINGKNITLTFWDTSGDFNFINITKDYIQRSKLIIIFYDITDNKCIENIDMWVDVARTYSKYPIYLIGNKNDLYTDRKVSKLDIQMYAEQNNITLHDEINIIDVNFNNIFMKIYRNIKDNLDENNEQITKRKCIIS